MCICVLVVCVLMYVFVCECVLVCVCVYVCVLHVQLFKVSSPVHTASSHVIMWTHNMGQINTDTIESPAPLPLEFK